MRFNGGEDQAEGLRRLLVFNQTQVITVVAGKAGVGRTSATLNLAAALARSGKDVLVLDENHPPNNLQDCLGLFARYDLLDVARGKCRPCDAVLTGMDFNILPVARAVGALAASRLFAGAEHVNGYPESLALPLRRELNTASFTCAKLDRAEQQRLESALTEVSDGVDVMLVDATMLIGQAAAQGRGASNAGGASHQHPASGRAEWKSPTDAHPENGYSAAASSGWAKGSVLLVVVEASPSGITESYALIKRFALENTRQQFKIVVNKAGSEKVAMTAYENMAKVARRNLSVHLEYLGCIPFDDRLRCSTQLGKSVVEAFPTAISAKSYLKLTQKLLYLPMRQDEADDGASAIIQSLVRHGLQPTVRTQCCEASGAG